MKNAAPKNLGQPPLFKQELSTDIIHVWYVRFNELMSFYDKFCKTLNLNEKQRANNIAGLSSKKKFILGRGFLRYILSRYLQLSPKDLEFTYSTNGKPEIAGKQHNIKFNLSHTNENLLLALSNDSDIGVDIEYTKRKVDAIGMAKKFFSTDEHQILLNLPNDQRMKRFFFIWTRKEALAKAIGNGIINTLPTNVSDDLLIMEGSKTYSIKSLFLEENYQAAIASLRDLKKISFYCFNFVNETF